MDNLKESFQSLLKGDKANFILVMSRLGIGFLFFLSLYFPFIFESSIAGGSASMAKMPGSVLYVLPIFLTIPIYFYLVLVKKVGLAKKVLLVQAIIATLTYVWGVLVLTVGFPSSSSSGFGHHLALILLIVIWFTYIRESQTLSLIKKYIIKDETPEQVVEEDVTE